MKTWVLILILSSNSGVSLHSIDGFASADSCELAGKTWLDAKKHNEWAAAVRDYVCMPKQ